MQSYNGHQVVVRYFEDSLFGSQDPAAEGYDAKASAQRYGELVTAAIEEAYPGIEVALEYAPYADNPVVVYGPVPELEERIRQSVEHITSRIFERGDWTVELEPCAYCGRVVQTPDAPPVGDERWESIAGEHEAGCEWVETRAHRVNVS